MTGTRIVAGLVGLAILMPLITLGGMGGTAFVVIMAMIICLGEYAQMAFPEDFRFTFYWMTLCAISFTIASTWAPLERAVAVGAILVCLTMVQITLAPPDPLVFAADRLGRMLIGIAWIGGTFPLLLRMRAWEGGFAWVLLCMVIAWFGDTGAYFGGRAVGRTPLYPLISPKKTWEGLAIGVLVAMLGVVGMKLWLLPVLSAFDCVVLGLVASVMAVLGDLSESLLKRSFEVKDSGWIMPGHGGLLDRVDSLLFVVPTVYGYALMLKDVG